jgi:hypothetical protein
MVGRKIMKKLKSERQTKEMTSVTGTYRYDKKLKRVVKISDHIPSLSFRAAEFDSSESQDVGPCGKEECAGGTCAMPGEDLE